ncbi:uncharacterized protein LOC116130405 [Pistacia vera]|uniref:uncharacterized protein LOC116130405 n=1 Tax=Pistacia vera TaxID=55513 RepID=UPI001262C715|nr:uncharacterized protein LOC116130405 [Pistacia vera]
MLDDLSSLAGRRLNVTQLASKYFHLRKVYQAWRKLFQHTGFGWDHESQTPTCPLQVWQEYIKQNPHAQQFFHKGLPHKELYEVIFEKQTTTRRYAYTSTSQPMENFTSFDQGPVDIDDSDFKRDSDQTIGEKQSNTSGHARSTNRRKRRGPRQVLVDVIGKLTNVLVERSIGSRASNRSRDEGDEENTSAPSDLFSMSHCIDVLTAMQVPTEFYMTTVKYLYQNPGWQEVFIKLPPDEKTNWIYNDFRNL